MIKKISKQKDVIQRTELGSIKAGGKFCSCGCDAPGCVDWIGQGIAITGGAASYFFVN